MRHNITPWEAELPNAALVQYPTYAAHVFRTSSAVHGHETNISPFGKRTDLMMYSSVLKMWRLRI